VADGYEIVFDGGALGNPGKGYGSFQIVGPGGRTVRERLEYGDRVTNNQAEYRTLIAALERVAELAGSGTAAARVRVLGDSSLVVNQVNGAWKVRHPDLRPLHGRAVELLRGFGAVDVRWHRRDASVRVLGH